MNNGTLLDIFLNELVKLKNPDPEDPNRPQTQPFKVVVEHKNLQHDNSQKLITSLNLKGSSRTPKPSGGGKKLNLDGSIKESTYTDSANLKGVTIFSKSRERRGTPSLNRSKRA